MKKLICCLIALLLIMTLPALAEESALEKARVYSNVITEEDIELAPEVPDKGAVHAEIRLLRSLEGNIATITAEVAAFPADAAYRLQWQNDLTGEFEDIPGETGSTIAFPATEENLRCKWRVAVTME